jgi:hypothetical protein
MRLCGLLVLASVLAVGCGSDDNSSPSPASANTVTFTATLLPSNEKPAAVSNAEQSGRGTATITFNLTRNSSNAIQSGTIDFRFDMNSFPAGTLLTLAHIHTGDANTAGPVLINTGLTAATAVALTNGTGSFEARGVTADAANLQAIIDNPAGFYFNVHSSTNPGGVARGQLVKQ